MICTQTTAKKRVSSFLQCVGIGTYTDIPMHVNAAIRIIKTRLLDRHKTVHRLFDRVAVKSVLYQIFLATTGLWTQEAEAEYKFDAVFWTRAEDFLDRSTIFPGQPISLNSPVLGVPISLFRLSFMLQKQYGSGLALDSAMLSRIRDEVAECEALLLCVRTADRRRARKALRRISTTETRAACLALSSRSSSSSSADPMSELGRCYRSRVSHGRWARRCGSCDGTNTRRAGAGASSGTGRCTP